MSYRNPYQQGTPHNRMFAFATRLARRFVQVESRLEVIDLVHSCVPEMEGLKRSWNPRLGTIETWAFRPFKKIMNECKRNLAPVQIGERRAIQASQIGKFEAQREALVRKIARSTPDELDDLLDQASALGRRILESQTDLAARRASLPRTRDGEPLSLEETLEAPEQPMHWEHRRQWLRVEQCLAGLPLRDATLVRMVCIGHLPSRIAGPACNLTHAGASGVVRKSLKRLRRELSLSNSVDLLDLE